MEASALTRIRAFEVSPARFVQLASLNVLLLWLIVGTGAAVRLTDSGLGCSHWPGCERGRPLPEKDIHAFVEFGNRLVGGVVITVTLLTWLAARKTPGLPVWVRRLRSECCWALWRKRRSATSRWRATSAGQWSWRTCSCRSPCSPGRS